LRAAISLGGVGLADVKLGAPAAQVPERRSRRHAGVGFGPHDPIWFSDLDIYGSGGVSAAVRVVDHDGLEHPAGARIDLDRLQWRTHPGRTPEAGQVLRFEHAAENE